VAPVVGFLVVYETPPDPAAFARHSRDVHIVEFEDVGR
jgi:hypothetical protein